MMKRKWGTLASLLAATGLVAVACGSQVAGTKKEAEPSVKPQAVVKNVECVEMATPRAAVDGNPTTSW